MWSAVQHSYEPRRRGLGYAVEFREGRDSMQQGGARQGGVAAFKCGIGRWKVGFAPGWRRALGPCRRTRRRRALREAKTLCFEKE